MEEKLNDSILHVCEILNRHSVEYLVVGGAAVTLHGHFRLSMESSGKVAEKPDLDFWYNPVYDNYFNLLNALEELGQDVTEFKEEKMPDPKKSFFRFELENFTLDLLPNVKAQLKFREAYSKRETVTLSEVEIPFISYEDLIVDKATDARPKDLTDIDQLEIKKKDKE
jgi:hypothetical protein